MNDIIISVLNQVILWKTLRKAAKQSKADNTLTLEQLERLNALLKSK